MARSGGKGVSLMDCCEKCGFNTNFPRVIKHSGAVVCEDCYIDACPHEQREIQYGIGKYCVSCDICDFEFDLILRRENNEDKTSRTTIKKIR